MQTFRSTAVPLRRLGHAVAIATLGLIAGCQEPAAPPGNLHLAASSSSAQLTPISPTSPCFMTKYACYELPGGGVLLVGGGIAQLSMGGRVSANIFLSGNMGLPVVSGGKLTLEIQGGTFNVRRSNSSGAADWNFSRLVPTDLIVEIEYGPVADIEYGPTPDLVIRTPSTRGAFTLGPSGAKFGGEDWGFGGEDWGLILREGRASITSADDWEVPFCTGCGLAAPVLSFAFSSGIVFDAGNGLITETGIPAMRFSPLGGASGLIIDSTDELVLTFSAMDGVARDRLTVSGTTVRKVVSPR